jgi:hypothetical protein
MARRDDNEETEFYLEPRVYGISGDSAECFNCQQTVYGLERKGCLCNDVRFRTAMKLAEVRGYDRGYHDGLSDLKKRSERNSSEES